MVAQKENNKDDRSRKVLIAVICFLYLVCILVWFMQSKIVSHAAGSYSYEVDFRSDFNDNYCYERHLAFSGDYPVYAIPVNNTIQFVYADGNLNFPHQ